VILLTVKKKGYKMLKVISACLVTLTLAGTVLGFEPQDVTTTDGKIFKQVTAVRMVRDKVVLIYADGTTFVPIASLSDDTRKSLGLRSRAEQSAFDAEQKQKELAAFEAAQIKKGLVKVGDEWITAKQKAMRDEEDKLQATVKAMAELEANAEHKELIDLRTRTVDFIKLYSKARSDADDSAEHCIRMRKLNVESNEATAFSREAIRQAEMDQLTMSGIKQIAELGNAADLENYQGKDQARLNSRVEGFQEAVDKLCAAVHRRKMWLEYLDGFDHRHVGIAQELGYKPSEWR